MQSIIPIEVLKSSRKALNLFNLYNSGFCIGCLNIPDIFIYFIILLPMLYFSIVAIWLCVDEHFHLKAVALTLACTISSLQMKFGFIALAANKTSIIATIAHLQGAVDRSNFHILIYQYKLFMTFFNCATTTKLITWNLRVSIIE